jgi:hypothetical protein
MKAKDVKNASGWYFLLHKPMIAINSTKNDHFNIFEKNNFGNIVKKACIKAKVDRAEL